jgi:hypothetical protein
MVHAAAVWFESVRSADAPRQLQPARGRIDLGKVKLPPSFVPHTDEVHTLMGSAVAEPAGQREVVAQIQILRPRTLDGLNFSAVQIPDHESSLLVIPDHKAQGRFNRVDPDGCIVGGVARMSRRFRCDRGGLTRRIVVRRPPEPCSHQRGRANMPKSGPRVQASMPAGI